MELVKILKPDFSFEDDRGTLTQLCREGFSQVNAIFTKKGAVRGGFHYHRFTKEAFFIISGGVRVSLYLGDKKQEYDFKSGDMFLIEENVRHSFEYKEDTYLVVLYTSAVEREDGTKDIVSDN